MPAWVTVSVAEIESALQAPELVQLREAALGDNSPDPIVGAISDVIARVRGYCASRAGNVLDRDQTLIPPELHQDAIWLVIQTLKLRLGVATPLSDDQRTRVRSAEQDLKDVALGRLLISRPLNPDYSSTQQGGGGAEVLPPRPRRFGGGGDAGYRPRISSGQTLGQAGIVDGVSNTGHYFCPPWLVGVDYSIIVNKPTTVADSGLADGVSTAALAAALAALLISPAFTSTPTAPTAAVDTNTTQLATTAFVINQGYLKAAAAAGAYAPINSPALTGVPTAPTAVAGTSTTQIATTAFVGTAVANLVNSSPAALDTLNELAAALGNDANFATTVTNSLALKAPLASPTFTGTVTIPNGAVIGNHAPSADGGASIGTSVSAGRYASIFASTALKVTGAASAIEVWNTNATTSTVNVEKGVFDWVTNAGFLTVGAVGTGSAATKDLYLVGNNILLRAASGAQVGLYTGGTPRWWCGSTGTWYPNATNTNDIGTSTNRPKDIYLGGMIYLGAGTTARPSLNIPAGTAPTTPNDGDVWQDGTNVKIRIGGATRTFNII